MPYMRTLIDRDPPQMELPLCTHIFKAGDCLKIHNAILKIPSPILGLVPALVNTAHEIYITISPCCKFSNDKIQQFSKTVPLNKNTYIYLKIKDSFISFLMNKSYTKIIISQTCVCHRYQL